MGDLSDPTGSFMQKNILRTLECGKCLNTARSSSCLFVVSWISLAYLKRCLLTCMGGGLAQAGVYINESCSRTLAETVCCAFLQIVFVLRCEGVEEGTSVGNLSLAE